MTDHRHESSINPLSSLFAILQISLFLKMHSLPFRFPYKRIYALQFLQPFSFPAS